MKNKKLNRTNSNKDKYKTILSQIPELRDRNIVFLVAHSDIADSENHCGFCMAPINNMLLSKLCNGPCRQFFHLRCPNSKDVNSKLKVNHRPDSDTHWWCRTCHTSQSVKSTTIDKAVDSLLAIEVAKEVEENSPDTEEAMKQAPAPIPPKVCVLKKPAIKPKPDILKKTVLPPKGGPKVVPKAVPKATPKVTAKASFKSTLKTPPRDWKPDRVMVESAENWAQLVTESLIADIKEMSCRQMKRMILALHHFSELQQYFQNNKALQEACTMLEEQLTDMERLSDLHENKSKNLEKDLARVRTELDKCLASLQSAESRAAEVEQRAGSVARQHIDAELQLEELRRQIDSLQDHLRDKESRCSELELREVAVSAERDSLQRKLSSAGCRLQQLQEECSALLTSTHQLTADNIRLGHQLKEAQEEAEAAREASEAAAAWWRTRETKADATLRQQAKLIDFLQSKVEEAGRKKKTLTDMLFGHRPHKDKDGPSYPSGEMTRSLLKERQANRELREELNMLKSQLPANSPLLYGAKRHSLRSEKVKTIEKSNGQLQKAKSERYVRIIRDGVPGSQRVEALSEEGAMLWREGVSEVRARVLNPTATHKDNLSQNDLRNSFSVRTVTANEEDSECVTVLCNSAAERSDWLSVLAAPGAGASPAPGLGYAPRALLPAPHLSPTCVVEVRPGLYAIGTEKGLYSYQSAQSAFVSVATPAVCSIDSVSIVVQVSRVVIGAGGRLHCADLRAFLSTLERSAFVAPELRVDVVPLPQGTVVDYFEVMPRRYNHDHCLVVVVSNHRLLFLMCDIPTGWKTVRIVELATHPTFVLFTPHTLLLAADTVYEVDLQRYIVEEFLDDSDGTLEAIARNSRAKAILTIKERTTDEETEYIVCYEEVGVFLDEFGRRTRSEDIKWSGIPTGWSYRKPYLYVLQSDRVEICKLEDFHYKMPPCQCDSNSIESRTTEEQAVPEKCTVKLQNPVVLGPSSEPGSLIIKEGVGKNCTIVKIDGTEALRKIGLSIESLENVDYSEVEFKNIDEPDGGEMSETETMTSHDTDDGQSNFLSDIRRRARQIRGKMQDYNRKEEAIREILSTEISAKFVPRTRKNSSDSLESDFSAESSANGDAISADSTEEVHVVGHTTADICNEMFLKKVRFDGQTSS